MDPAHDRRVVDMHAPLGHEGDEIAVAQAVSKVPANAAFDDFARESATPVYGIAFNGLRHGKLRAKAPDTTTRPPMHQNHIQTPCLILDLDALERNIR
jgi:hypothetical protein